jgi:hypothetical protein
MRKLSGREKVLIGMALAAGLGYLLLRGGALGGGGAEEADDLLLPFEGEPPIVRLDRLATLSDDYDPKGRDLFKYGPPPGRAKPPPPPPPRRETPKIERPTPSPRPKPPPREPPKPKPPTPSFDYLGYLGPKDDRIAVFGKGEDMLLARVGDVVQDQFRVLEFKYEVIVMGFTDDRFRGETTELSVKQ